MCELKPFKQPDLHAPRHRTKAIDFLAYPNKDTHGFFVKLKKQHPQMEQYSNREIAGWIKVYSKQMALEVVNNRNGATLPGGLGGVVTAVSRPSEMTCSHNVDFKTSKELGFEVHYSNDTSEGMLAKIYYTNKVSRCKLKNYRVTFEPCRNVKREVAAIMKTERGYNKYWFSSPQSPVTNLFQKVKPPKQTWRNKLKEKEELEYQRYLREEYNDFDLSDSSD